MIKKNWILVLIYIVVLLLYYPVLNTFFAGDDFFHFTISKVTNLVALLKFFGFYPFDVRDIAFYRPLFREIAYGVSYLLFGLNHIPLRVLALAMHLVNISLVYKLTKKLFKSNFVAGFSSFFFGTTAANVGILYYLAGGIQTLGATMFLLLSLLSFLKRKKVWAFVFFLLGLASHEQAIVIPVLLAGLVWVKERKLAVFAQKAIKQFWVYGVVVVSYLYLNFNVIGFSASEVQYQPDFGLGRLINTLGWYAGWALGLPEMLVDFVRPGLLLNPNLMKFWGNYFQIIFPAFFVSLATLGLLVGWLAFKKSEIFKDKRFWFFVFWFPVALVPVLFLPIHKKTYYLAPALPGIWGAIAYLVSQVIDRKQTKLRTLVVGLLIVGFAVLNVSSIKLSEKTYWAINRSKVAEKVLQDLKNEYPTLPKGATLYIKNDPNYPFISESWGSTSTQTSLAISGSDAVRLMYDDPTISVVYEDSGQEILGDVIEFVAVIN